VAGVALVNKLRAILLMEADFNYMNKWIFGHEAINKMYALGYVAEDQYSQKRGRKLDNKLTMDLSRQLRHPLATMLADADKCYDRINHIVMSLLLLVIIGTIGPVVGGGHAPPHSIYEILPADSARGLLNFRGWKGPG